MKKKQQQTPDQQAKKPFFARFLESQELSKASGAATTKYPSDNDEYWP